MVWRQWGGRKSDGSSLAETKTLACEILCAQQFLASLTLTPYTMAWISKAENLLVDLRSENMKLTCFGRAGCWDLAVGDANDLVYDPSEAPLNHSAPEV